MALKQSIEKIDKLKAEYDKFLPFKKEDEQRLWKKLRLEWNYNSNHIEGNTLTYGETELLLLRDKATGDHTMREFEEMKAHDVAVAWIKEHAKDERDLTEGDIKNLNKIILKEPFWKEAETTEGKSTRKEIIPGEYKTTPNSVRLPDGSIFEYASPQETPVKMKELMDFYNNKKGSTHPVVLAALLHHEFVLIHPFDDGNGRTARLMMNYILMRSDYPPIVIKSEDKQSYLTALQKADTGDQDAFAEYITRQLEWSLNLSIAAAKGYDLEEPDDLDKKLAILDKKLQGINKEEATVKKSDQIIRKLFRNSLMILLNKLMDQSNKFVKYFNETSFGFMINSQGKSSLSKNNFYPAISAELDRQMNINSISFEVRLNGFKKVGSKAFDVMEDIRFEFEDWRYLVKDGRKRREEELYEKTYHQTLTEQEISTIEKSFSEQIYNAIEGEIDRATKNK